MLVSTCSSPDGSAVPQDDLRNFLSRDQWARAQARIVDMADMQQESSVQTGTGFIARTVGVQVSHRFGAKVFLCTNK